MKEKSVVIPNRAEFRLAIPFDCELMAAAPALEVF